MSLTARLCSCLLVSTIVVAGCTSAAKLEPKGAVSVMLEPGVRSASATARLMNLVNVTLPPAREPGQAWQIALHDPRFLKQTTEIVLPPAATGGSTIAFLAQAPGRTRLRFVLLPAGGARAVDPIDFQELILTIE